jgi:hypothetical protein
MAFAFGLPAAAQEAPQCPASAPRVLLERYVSADCELCWAAVPPRADPAVPAGMPVLALDWIVPGARGEEAPLAAAAIGEARARLARSGPLRSDETLVISSPLPARSALRLVVEDGPGWNGYVGLQLKASYASSRPLPAGLTGWLALIELVPAGSDGTPGDRRLVRALIGPLPLDELGSTRLVEHLRAARLPETARPERISSVGWIETAAGRVLAVAVKRDLRCTEPKRPPA